MAVESAALKAGELESTAEAAAPGGLAPVSRSRSVDDEQPAPFCMSRAAAEDDCWVTWLACAC